VSAAFAAEFARLRAAVSAELPDWTEIRLVFQLLEAHATTPAMHEALDNLMTTPDRAGLKLAVDRLEAAFAGTTSRR
jgi:predicted RNA polymerase sigma factor